MRFPLLFASMPREAASPLVSPSWLANYLADADVRVVDTRWYLDGRSGRAAYEAGHIPGAVWMDVDTDLAGPKGPGRPGRHPIPGADAFAKTLARAGISSETRVVAYDDDGGSKAARLWWLLRYFGHGASSYVLDGGLQAWSAEHPTLETTVPNITPVSPRTLTPGHAKRLGKDQVAHLTKGLLLDARGADRYEGIVEPIDARKGHIPGAVNAPYVNNLVAPGGAFLSADELRARYQSLGVTPETRVIVYCGSGVTACHDVLALSLAGIDAELYEGSWSEWSGDPTLPIRTGKAP